MRSHHRCPQHFGSVFSQSQSGVRVTGKGRGAVWTHRPRHQASADQKSTLSGYVFKMGMDQVGRQDSFHPISVGHTDSICDSEPGVGPRRGWRLLPECARASASASAYCTVPGRCPFCKSSSALTVRFSLDGSSHGSHLTECDWLCQECRENRKRHLRSRRCQLLTAERQAILPAPNSSLWEVDAQERSRRARSLLIQVGLWAPSMVERDIVLEALRDGLDRQLR